MKYLLMFILAPFILFAQITEEEMSFENPKDSLHLSGTLSLPQGAANPPLVILISGSGQSDRDHTIYKHKPFKTIAEDFAAKGIAVLRYDDRGGFRSTGPGVMQSTSYQLSEDADYILNSLRKDHRFQKSMIGFIGHSEGGLIAPTIAARNSGVDFIVSMAGTGTVGKELLVTQNRAIIKQQGVKQEAQDKYIKELFEPSLEIIANNSNLEQSLQNISKLTNTYRSKAGVNSLIPAVLSSKKYAETIMTQLGGTWGKYFLNTNPSQFWSQVTCPVLALNGDKDIQVDATINTQAIKKALTTAGNTKYIIKILQNHNHLFQETENGSIIEYGTLKESISSLTLNTMSSWILSLPH